MGPGVFVFFDRGATEEVDVDEVKDSEGKVCDPESPDNGYNGELERGVLFEKFC